MKYIFKPYSFVLGILTLLATSCDSKLDVLPTQSIDENAALATSSDVEVTLIGCYDGLQDAELYGGGFQVISELMGNSNELLFGGTFQNLLELFNKTITAGNSTAQNTWADSYNTINRANNVLSALSIVDEEKRSRIEGEALFIRGSIYFELVRLYAKPWGDGNNSSNPGVPIVLTPTRGITDDDYRPRSSVAEVYAQAISDLTRAKELLPEDNLIYATKSAATAQLSRVYLMQGEFAAARDAANELIESGKFSLSPTIADNYQTFLTNGGANPDEYIFAMTVTQQDGVNALNTYFGSTIGTMPGTSGRGDIRIATVHRALYEAGDLRSDFFITPTNNTFTRKHLDTFGNVLTFRLAEMYLTRAETNFRLGTEIGESPLADVNMIRVRAGLPEVTSVTLETILKERHLELAFEGHSLHDAKRTGANVGTFAFNAPELILPIPLREMDVNPQLVQNEGYN